MTHGQGVCLQRASNHRLMSGVHQSLQLNAARRRVQVDTDALSSSIGGVFARPKMLLLLLLRRRRRYSLVPFRLLRDDQFVVHEAAVVARRRSVVLGERRTPRLVAVERVVRTATHDRGGGGGARSSRSGRVLRPGAAVSTSRHGDVRAGRGGQRGAVDVVDVLGARSSRRRSSTALQQLRSTVSRRRLFLQHRPDRRRTAVVTPVSHTPPVHDVLQPIFTPRRYASAVYAVVVCLCVLTHSGIVSKRLNVGSRK